MYRRINENIEGLNESGAGYQDEMQSNNNLTIKIIRICNSTILLIVSFILANLILNLSIVFIAYLLRYSIRFSYNHVAVLPMDYRYWSVNRVIAIYLTPPVACLLAAGLLFNLLNNYKTVLNSFRLFVFWLMVCLANIFLFHLLFSPLGIDDRSMVFYNTFAIVGTWLSIKPMFMVPFSIIAVIGSILTGMLIAKELLRFRLSWKLTKSEKGKNVVAFQLFLLPVVLSAAPLLFLTTALNFLPTVFALLNLLLIALGIFISNSNYTMSPRISRKDVLGNFMLSWVLAGVCLWGVVYKFLK